MPVIDPNPAVPMVMAPDRPSKNKLELEEMLMETKDEIRGLKGINEAEESTTRLVPKPTDVSMKPGPGPYPVDEGDQNNPLQHGLQDVIDRRFDAMNPGIWRTPEEVEAERKNREDYENNYLEDNPHFKYREDQRQAFLLERQARVEADWGENVLPITEVPAGGFEANAARIQRRYPTREPDPASLAASQGKVTFGDVMRHEGQKLRESYGLPGDVYQGKIDPLSDEGIKRAAALGGSMVAQPGFNPGSVGSFGGFLSMVERAGLKGFPGNREAVESLRRATDAAGMLRRGEDPAEVFRKTGWFEGADGKLRFEIADKAATINTQRMGEKNWSRTRLEKDPNDPKGGLVQVKEPVYGMGKEDIPLGEILRHPLLFNAYPELKDVKVGRYMGFGLFVKGNFDSDAKRIGLAPGTAEDLKSVLLHEIQHWIQTKEGFARGGNPEMFQHKDLPHVKNLFEERSAELQKEIKDKNPSINDDILRGMKAAITEEDQARLGLVTIADQEKKNPEMGKFFNEYLKELYGKTLKLVDLAHKTKTFDVLKQIAQGEEMLKKLDGMYYERYNNLAGEVESRNVQNRMDMDYLTRAASYPGLTEDVARDLQTFIMPD